MIRIFINGEPTDVAGDMTLDRLVAEFASDPAVVTAVNETFVPRNAQGQYRLQAGDAVELVTAMEGG
ncbi:MAG: thiamine biosynthesis protein ThiS [Porticoccaceae bacterium]|nr:thiamine biosynthesis protein ThiS [Porticoccaceae bacterium]